MHNFANEPEIDAKRHRAELEYLVTSDAAKASMAENYVGLPW